MPSSSSDHQELLRSHLQQLLAGPGGRELLERAAENLALLGPDRAASAESMRAIEVNVLPGLRPVLDVIDGRFEVPEDLVLFPGLRRNRDRVAEALRCVGRVNVTGLPGSGCAGTAFTVGENLMMTNRHVANLIAEGVGVGTRLAFRPGCTATVDLKQEVQPSPPVLLRVERVELIHPYWDMALLRVRDLPEGHPRLALASDAPPSLDGVEVVTIGYPTLDPHTDLQVQMQVFRGIFERKRLQPGFLRGVRALESYGRTVQALAHDCSTLGGNSGACVLDVETGRVVGLHFAGQYLESNDAVPAWELARDPRVVACGVEFQPPASPTAPPPWDGLWPAEDGRPSPARRPAIPAVEWYERHDRGSLRLEWATDPEGTRERLEKSAGPAETRNLVARLDAPQAKGLFGARKPPDPNLPELVYLHGIMGSHLDSNVGRIWLDILRLITGDAETRLELAEDGVTDATSGERITAGPIIKLFYGWAADAWRDQGFVVHEFSFDWRKGIERCADRLHFFLEMLAADRPDKPFVLVAHSMGGMVAALYAQRHDSWRKRIQRAILLGSPLGGSYAPFEAVLGTYPLFQKLKWVSGQKGLDALRRSARTMPGLLDMLPDPELFPSAKPLYEASRWPGGMVPARQWLEQSLRIKKACTASPLLERASLIVSIGHGTVCEVVEQQGVLAPGPRTGRGDGTVPALAAAIRGIPAWCATWQHSDLPREPQVITAVMGLAREGRCALPPLKDADLQGAVVLPKAIHEAPGEHHEARAAQVRQRALEGRLEGEDFDWLVSTSLPASRAGTPGAAEPEGGPEDQAHAAR